MSQEHRDDLVETAQRYLPGGSSWMWTLPRHLSLVVDRAKGSHLIDTNGGAISTMRSARGRSCLATRIPRSRRP
jgi:glutamate-1-semialdehyde aminotransferase